VSVEVHHLVEGPPGGPVLVLSNSLGSTLDMWEPQVAVLANEFRVVRYDLRGHGRSPVPPPPYDLSDLGADLLALLDGLGVERAHLAGLSIGAMVSMWVAAHAPDRVDRLVLCCTSPRFAPPAAWFERAALVRAEGTGAVADLVVGRWFTPGFARREPAVVTRMREMIATTPPEGYAACCEAVGTADLRATLGDIRADTLVVSGARDPSMPQGDARLLAEGIPRCRAATVDAAHLANVERPEEVTALIREHLLASEEAR